MFQTFILVVIVHNAGLPQTFTDETQSGFRFLPGGTTFTPLLAHYQEPRVGVRKETGSSHLKLDIGAMLDVLEYRFPDSSSSLRLGIDFFTYALATNSEGLRLQVDAVDGFFGGHVVFRSGAFPQAFSLRLRLLHLSAHFLDGHYNMNTSSWKDGREPLPFTRDFGELVGAYESSLDKISFRAYSGFGYATLIRPVEIKRLTMLHGVELWSANILGPVFAKSCNLFIAYHLTVAGIPTYQGTNNLEVGAKFGEMQGTGIRLYASYYSGLEIYSQYYDVRTENWGLGVAFDFW